MPIEWGTQSDWDNATKTNIEVVNGTFQLAQAIPASEADSKLIHRWYLSEDSDPFVDQVGSSNGTNNGTTQVTGSWVDGAARDGDGVDDYIDVGSLSDLNDNLASGFAISLSIQTSDGSGTPFGNFDSFERLYAPAMGGGGNNGAFTFFQQDGGNNARVSTNSDTFNDGSPYRVVLNQTGQSGSSMEIWVNQSEESLTVESDQNLEAHSPSTDYALFQRSGLNDEYWSGVIDDFCIFNNPLSQSEIQSYTNPW